MQPQSILVPCDFSLTSNAAIAKAITLCRQAPAELHLLHVVTPPTSPLGRASGPGSESWTKSLEELQALIPRRVELPSAPKFVLREGKAVGEILKYATEQQIQLIVLGTHGRTGISHVALGSVAEKVIRKAPCPVLVVPRDQRSEDELMRQAAESLTREFGETLYGPRDQTEQQLKERLERVLEVDLIRLESLFHMLQDAGVLTWTSADERPSPTTKGEWRIGPPTRTTGRPAPRWEGESAPALDLLQRALSQRASDIHLDPWSADEYLVRFRVDGSLESYCRLDTEIAERLIQQLKMLANLDIADPFHPQEGRLRVPAGLGSSEVRLTTTPAIGGEAVAMRLFSLEHVFRELGQLGLSPRAGEDIQRMLRRGEGIVLVTGPTGSGKTTTVYSMLAELGDGSRNIVSIEDPVEYPIPFVRQTAVDERHGISMTSGLRTMLRMDPDVLFVGEVRDVEAAEIAMRAASSGKYVFSTLHTRDVASTITAVRDLRIDNRSLAANLTGIVSQRLVRRLCPHCRERRPVSAEEQEALRQNEIVPPETLFHPRGCEKCQGRGFHGRIGVFEVAIMDEVAVTAIARGASEMELRQLLRSRGTISLNEDALRKVLDGTTVLREALQMTWI